MILASASPVLLLLSLVTALAYAVPALPRTTLSAPNARQVLLLAWTLHAVCLGLGLSGEMPRFGFAPALSVTAWLVAGFYAVESHVYPQLKTRWALSALGAAAVLLALVFPGKVLHASASPWLALHWALGIASYGLFAAAATHAWFMNLTEERIRLAADTHTGLPLLTLERLTFRFVAAGFILLTATLIAGVWFSETLYGRAIPWKWDHKTIFSLLSWLTFAVLLLGRWRLGWRGRRAATMLYIGSGLLLLAYVGSRFVLEVFLRRGA